MKGQACKAPVARTPGVATVLALSARVGNDPLLTQGSTGNASIKVGRHLWIKASGKWMADAAREDILVPLPMADVHSCIERNIDPTGPYPSASIETAMHAVLPHRVVLHVHCVNTIAWAVRRDGPRQLQDRLEGLRWRWIPYVASGLALAQELEKHSEADVFVLANHGLVLGGPDANAVECLLEQVRRRLALPPRQTRSPDYDALERLADANSWDAPKDNMVHSLGIDPVSRAILSGGLLYPCQAIFSNCSSPAGLFRPVRPNCVDDLWTSGPAQRPFIIVEDYGVLLSRSASAAMRAMILGLAQVVQRVGASAPVRYLAEDEAPNPFGVIARRYRELSSQNYGGSSEAADSAHS